ncbi:MAG: hypothetical protein R3E39_28875 [Anaerolineae bacterium]
MWRRLMTGCALLWLMAGIGVRAQDKLPPPLGYGVDSERSERYSVYDFESQQSSSYVSHLITYYGDDGSPQEIPTPQPEIEIQSPLDPSVRFVRVLQQGGRPDFSEYALYRLNADGSRRLVADYASVPRSLDYWSPNGRYVYLMARKKTDKNYYVYSYDLKNDTVQPLGTKIEGLDSCLTNKAWCIVFSYEIEDIPHPPSRKFLLNRNEASLRELKKAEGSIGRIKWLASGNEMIYASALSETRIRIYHYSVSSDQFTVIGEMDGEINTQFLLSPDEHWLAVQSYLTTTQESPLVVFDMTQRDQTPLVLTREEYSLSNAPRSPYWIDNDTLIFSTHKSRKDTVVYRVTMPEGEPQELARFPPDLQFYDHDWSPDGKWLALATYNYSAEPTYIYVVSLETGEVNTLPVDLPDGQSICVGWFTQAEYESGNANICDVYLGMG